MTSHDVHMMPRDINNQPLTPSSYCVICVAGYADLQFNNSNSRAPVTD